MLALRRCVMTAKAAELKEKERAAKSLAKAADALLAAAPLLDGALGSLEDEGRAALTQYLATLPCAPQVRRRTSESRFDPCGK